MLDSHVYGLDFRGTDTTSIELRIEYVTDCLAQLRDPETQMLRLPPAVKRGEIGVVLQMRSFAESMKHMRFPLACVQALKEKFPGTGIKYVIVVQSTIAFSESEEAGLKSGGLSSYTLSLGWMTHTGPQISFGR